MKIDEKNIYSDTKQLLSDKKSDDISAYLWAKQVQAYKKPELNVAW